MSDLTPQFLVYKITNRVNGKLYVGVTTRDLRARWRDHAYGASVLKRNYALHSAIRKYGEAAFVIEVVQCCISIDGMLEAERQLVVELGTLVPNGYNMVPGGRAGRGVYGPMSEGQRLAISRAWKSKTNEEMIEFSQKMSLVANERARSLEYRQKLSAANTGKRVTESAKEKIRAARSQQVFSPEAIEKRTVKLRGRSHSETSRANMSAAQKGRTFTEEHAAKISKTLRGLDTAVAAIIKFDAWDWLSKDYARHFNVSSQVVCDIQKGRTYKDVTEADLT